MQLADGRDCSALMPANNSRRDDSQLVLRKQSGVSPSTDGLLNYATATGQIPIMECCFSLE